MLHLLLAAFILAGCGGGGGSFVRPTPVPIPIAPIQQSPIKHVVIIVQENRSFDNLFYGFPGADTATSGINSHGTQLQLQPRLLDAGGGDPGHFHASFRAAYDGSKLDGFNLEGLWGFVGPTYSELVNDSNVPYSYVPQSEIQPYWTLAQQYTLADRMFQSNSGPSYPAHQ